jgi:selenocysteine lyase/cysteine desulfurase
LIGVGGGELVIMLNASQARSSVASCLDFARRRRRVVVSELDFPIQSQVWLAQQRRGAEIVVVRSPDGIWSCAAARPPGCGTECKAGPDPRRDGAQRRLGSGHARQ